MELRTDLMKMADLDKFKRLLYKYKNIPDLGIVFGLTNSAKGAWATHDDEERWEELTLLFVTKSREDVLSAAGIFRAWAQDEHSNTACYQVGCEDHELPEESSRYWLYILR
ncbi:MAG: hypothetical protein ACI9MC_004149 [Kiritimatiellia bacterium]|jgi:hypothetical protein